ncbi:helix-turn-helix transcriptional regulator [Kitasatospora aureofaciens]|uniref:helix-turn-helix domain-containing protein n=1 Tax=Kitasatospora aureofaciens TaxID=1894 RepID=UPI001C44FE15|nr:helix-turn-helix transcriptional regulator [Kitasatospora aureofaciens]MBV6699629.1 helix-turn-helix transcriptional regulator [Kitasatospora aureofaciens]
MRRRQPPALPPVPFSPAAARAHRAGLGLTPEQVADGMAAHGIRLLPTHVLAWESGELRPTEEEFIALARTLWCPPAHLMGTRPARLRDYRVARELNQDTAAGRIGIALRRYQDAELTGRWDGDEDQTYALAQVLGLRLTELVEVTGRSGELDQRLRRCVDGRWQAHVRAIARLVPVHADDLAAVLAALQQENQVSAHWGAATWGAPTPTEPVQARDLATRFWELLGRQQPDIPV